MHRRCATGHDGRGTEVPAATAHRRPAAAATRRGSPLQGRRRLREQARLRGVRMPLRPEHVHPPGAGAGPGDRPAPGVGGALRLYPQLHLTFPAWVHEAVDATRTYASDADKVGLAIDLSRHNIEA